MKYMRKPILFFDWDDTMINSRPLKISYFEKRYGISITYEELNHKNANSLNDFLNSKKSGLNISFDEAYLDYARNFWKSFNWNKDLIFLPYSIEVIKSLSFHYDLYIVTQSQKTEKVFIQEIVNKYFSNCFSGIHCVWEYVYGSGYLGNSKLDFIKNIEGEKIAFVDDSVSEILKVQPFIDSYLFDPKKENFDSNIKKVLSWLEIGNMFLK